MMNDIAHTRGAQRSMRTLIASTLFLRLFICSMLVSLSGMSQAQTLSNNPRGDVLTPLNSAQLGFTKIASTFIFHGDADIHILSSSEDLSVRQLYRGSTIRSVSSTFRDDEVFMLRYRRISSSLLQPIIQTDAQVSRDSRSIGLSSLTRINAGVGCRCTIDSNVFAEVQAGAESNKLLGVQDNGGLIRLNATASNLDMEQYLVSTRLNSEFSIFPRRTNGEIDALLQLVREFDLTNTLRFNVSYRTLNRDWYSQIASDTLGNTIIETRLEKRLNAEAQLQFGITSSVNAEIISSLSNAAVSRAFKDVALKAPSTAIGRELSEIQLSILSNITFQGQNQRHVLSLGFFSRDEQNTAEKQFDILSALQLDTLQEQERVRDNSMSRSQFSLRSLWNLHPHDTLLFNGAFSNLRYDTPSALNNDDRDELNLNVSAGYGRRFSPVFAANVTGRIQLNHLVFIKAQRSALNSWNRIIQFAPSAQYTTTGFSMRPQLEVLAQYSVYDFEGKAGVPSSFSFRQIAYRDSLTASLGPTMFAEARVYLRTFERGELYWSSFAELRLSHNYEQYIRLMFFSQSDASVLIGGGIRWYSLSQENLQQKSSGNALRQSLGPECSFSFAVNAATTLFVSGWYEIQYSNHVHYRDVPNVTLNLRRSLY